MSTWRRRSRKASDGFRLPGSDESKNFDIPIPQELVSEPVRLEGFPLSRSYLDRSRENEYPIIASWSVRVSES